jgi:hypothetical protein
VRPTVWTLQAQMTPAMIESAVQANNVFVAQLVPKHFLGRYRSLVGHARPTATRMHCVCWSSDVHTRLVAALYGRHEPRRVEFGQSSNRPARGIFSSCSQQPSGLYSAPLDQPRAALSWRLLLGRKCRNGCTQLEHSRCQLWPGAET